MLGQSAAAVFLGAYVDRYVSLKIVKDPLLVALLTYFSCPSHIVFNWIQVQPLKIDTLALRFKNCSIQTTVLSQAIFSLTSFLIKWMNIY